MDEQNFAPSQKWDFPLILPRNPLKRALKHTLGRIVLTLNPSIGARVETAGEAKSFVEELALAGLIGRYRAQNKLDRLSHFHAKFWAGRNAVSVHSAHAHRFREEFLLQSREAMDALGGVLAASQVRRLYEIGCGSGQVLDHLAKRFPALEQLVGIDLSAEQIELNKGRYHDSRLAFIRADGVAWIEANGETGSALFTYGGVLEYFTQQAVERLLAALVQKAPSCIAIIEPIDRQFDLTQEFQSRQMGSELSFSHNYAHLLTRHGFEILWQKQIDSGNRWIQLIGTVKRRDGAGGRNT